jgi:tetratricopeptide (TPR) repeat protein/DNA-binding response OmpR family regulator
MAKAVLIVEDDQSASRLLASICAELHLTTQATGSAVSAQALCAEAEKAGAPFACVLLDLVLAEQDGFKFALAARAQPWGAALPLVVVSGVYKQLPPDFGARAKPAAFFAKPFEPQALRDALTRICGVQAAPSFESDLAEKPAVQHFVELLQKKATGSLTLSQDQTRRVIAFQQGQIRFAQANVKAETVGAAQVASGLIKQASFDRAVALARQQKTPLHEALAAARVLSHEQLKMALKQQTVEVCVNALPWTSGKSRFEPQTLEQVSTLPDVRISPVILILEAARKHGVPAESRRWLEAHGQEKLNRSPELERELFSVKSAWPGESVTPFATGGRSVAEVLSRMKDAELPLLHYLCLSGLLQLTGNPAAAPRPVAAATVGAPDDDRGKVFSAAESAARRMLFGERDHLKDATHYEVLGVPPEATVEEIKQAYFAQAKRFHSDSFSGMELGSARRVSEEIFSKVSEAYTVLSTKEQRGEYDVFVDRKAKGLPTDVGAILRAEGLFQKGELYFKAGKWEDAQGLFRDAIALNHAEAEFHAYLGMATFRHSGKADQGLQHLEKALELDPRVRKGSLFTAQLLEASGDVERAKTVLRRAIDKDPEFSEAKDELRRLKTRPAEQKKGGFFGRLLKK